MLPFIHDETDPYEEFGADGQFVRHFEHTVEKPFSISHPEHSHSPPHHPPLHHPLPHHPPLEHELHQEPHPPVYHTLQPNPPKYGSKVHVTDYGLPHYRNENLFFNRLWDYPNLPICFLSFLIFSSLLFCKDMDKEKRTLILLYIWCQIVIHQPLGEKVPLPIFLEKKTR